MPDDMDKDADQVDNAEVNVGIHDVEPPFQGRGFQTLKDDKTFAILTARLDIVPSHEVPGVYDKDVRVCSQLELICGGCELAETGRHPHISADNSEIHVSLTNNELVDALGNKIPSGALTIDRRAIVRQGTVLQEIILTNASAETVGFAMDILHGCDYLDMFVLRDRSKPNLALGTKGAVTAEHMGVERGYVGLDEESRPTHIVFSDRPEYLDNGTARFSISLKPSEQKQFYLEAGAGPAPQAASAARYNDARNALQAERARLISHGATVSIGNPDIQQWYDRSIADLAMLMNHYDTGLYPCAGLPWFSTPFGRDGIMTAKEMLWAKPEVAKGVLLLLAAHQATDYAAKKAAQPGQVPHEIRYGESANAGIVPFGCYYGGVDTTLAWIELADLYERRTGDRETIRRIMPNIERALEWAQAHEDAQGFFTYTSDKEGLGNQFFKDSQDSVLYEDGDINVKLPRAINSVQGYAYAAWRSGERLSRLAGDAPKADYYKAKADQLYKSFNASQFWMKDRQAYAMAMDGEGRPCRVISSDMGELLSSGIVPPERTGAIVRHMIGDKSFTGFGIRTLQEGEGALPAGQKFTLNEKGEKTHQVVGFDPNSYHRGSIWPHVTAQIAAGMADCGYVDEARQLCLGLADVARQRNGRLPEVFSGLSREQCPQVVDYPSSCSPQAWAAAASFQCLQTMLGLRIDAARCKISLSPNQWPAAWGAFTVHNLQVGGGTVSLKVDQGRIEVLDQKGAFITVEDRRSGRIVNAKAEAGKASLSRLTMF